MAKRSSLLPTYTLLAAFVFCGALFAGYAYWYESDIEPVNNKAATSVSATGQRIFTKDDPWPIIYPNTKAMKVGDVSVRASVAETWPERIRGLSNTPYLPMDVVKFFIFDSPGFHSIWMKDMNYPIDIVWVDEGLNIIYIEEEVTPETYPNLFVPASPAKYVIETASGFVAKNQISIGQVITLP